MRRDRRDKHDLYWNDAEDLHEYPRRSIEHWEYEVGQHCKNYKSNKTELTWNVFLWFNQRGLVVWNIFENDYVRRGLLEAKTKHKTFRAFAARLHQLISHEYWARVQYELSIGEYPRYNKDDETTRVDAALQVAINWDQFAEYVWRHRNLITKDWVENYGGYFVDESNS